jgi:hypothetical protein
MRFMHLKIATIAFLLKGLTMLHSLTQVFKYSLYVSVPLVFGYYLGRLPAFWDWRSVNLSMSISLMCHASSSLCLAANESSHLQQPTLTDLTYPRQPHRIALLSIPNSQNSALKPLSTQL